MTKSELPQFRAILTARVAELAGFARKRDGITVERSADQLEESLAVRNLDREFNHLRDARAALRRIQEGSFGVCQGCDEQIHPKRLAAVPWAACCIRCQEAVDRNLGRHEAASRDVLNRAA